jgi:excisionase family DNA binding protein
MDEFLTCKELAARLRVQPATVLEWARKGKIPSIHIGHKTLRFDFAAVVQTIRDLSGTKGLARGDCR